MTQQPVVLTEFIESALLITINRPDVRNAVNSEVSTLIGEALEEANRNDAIRSVIITGSGDKAFCAGADLRALSLGQSLYADDRSEWSFAGYTNHPISKPTIAAVNGAAIGGGMEIILASDLVVASNNSSFGLTEARRGVVAGGGGAFRLPQRIPSIIAMEMLYFGSIIDAQRAQQLNLINEVTTQDDLLTTALSYAHRISKSAPLSVSAHKRLALGLNSDMSSISETKLWEMSREEVAKARASHDANEGALAFLEKREPQWLSR